MAGKKAEKEQESKKKGKTIGEAIAEKVNNMGVNDIVSDFVKEFADQIFLKLKDIFKLKLKEARTIIVKSFILSLLFIVAIISIVAGLLMMLFAGVQYLIKSLPFVVPPGADIFLFGVIILIAGYIFKRSIEKKIDNI